MNWHITYGSVCSGIEAASVAWHMLGFRASWFAEIEPFPSAVLAHRWPAVPNLGDMTKLAREVLLGIIAAPLILVGGTPCQDFSVAGMRAGLAGERGALTMKFVELADAIDHVRPDGDECVVVWENVPGVLSDKGNAFGNFLAALVGESEELQPPGGKWKDAGCVYGPKRAAAWRILDAQYFGLAQRRRRVFVIASARAGFDPCEVLFEREGMRRDHPPRRGQGTNVAGTLTSSLGKNSGIPAGNESGLLVAFGGSANCKQTDVSTALSAHPGGTRMDAETETFVVHGAQDPDAAPVHSVCLGSDPISARELAQPITTRNGDPGTIQQGSGVRRLTPRECERLQGLPDDYTLIPWRGKPVEECPDGPRYKAIGNSKAVPVVRWIGRRLLQQLERTA
ncbi:DNA cytosine methyltransferase [Pseudomonas aeruginosa]|uniref:DNA cytosine methyltransferase n=1 Tax=Pseudomonas aeruginosa TaxID=287 RepID=UPI000F83A21E|nr:DNA cytosine methyltransferase [Pseudomonas aeruginosa]MBG6270837.1 DNA cytosine methyltransferase [Pseudomonas aeruginosa]MBI7773764.1 DNA cytosine methyltransferase [Pseudomonas aeruginosa]RTS60797.1 DNA cytosine methyltransferase [Pseudomonas aeruginosa]